MVILYFFHFRIMVSTSLLLTKLLADDLVANTAFCRSPIVSLMSFDSSLVLPMVVERMEWKIGILWTGFLYK